MREPQISPELQDKIRQMIALFEGSRYGNINTWDGQLLSVGTFHYALRLGAGYAFLRQMYDLDPEAVQKHLGKPFAAAIRQGRDATIAFCEAYVAGSNGKQWVDNFRDLSYTDCYEVADRIVGQRYILEGAALAHRLNLTTERGLAWAVDRQVHQGGLSTAKGAKKRPQVWAAFERTKNDEEWQRMKAMSHAFADSAGMPRVVRPRALTVALGDSAGTGYPGRINLEKDFGIRYGHEWERK